MSEIDAVACAAAIAPIARTRQFLMPRAATRRTSRCTSSFALLLAAAAVSATGDASSSARAGCPCRDFFSADGMYVRAIECHVWANADDFSDCAADQLSSLTETSTAHGQPTQ